LGLVGRFLAMDQVRSFLDETAVWLGKEEQLKDTYVRVAYLSLVKNKGSVQQAGLAIETTRTWLERAQFAEAKVVWPGFVTLVERKGSKGQLRETITSVQKWLSLPENTEDPWVRSALLAVARRSAEGDHAHLKADE